MTWPAAFRSWADLERAMGESRGAAAVVLVVLAPLLVGLYVVSWVTDAGW